MVTSPLHTLKVTFSKKLNNLICSIIDGDYWWFAADVYIHLRLWHINFSLTYPQVTEFRSPWSEVKCYPPTRNQIFIFELVAKNNHLTQPTHQHPGGWWPRGTGQQPELEGKARRLNHESAGTSVWQVGIWHLGLDGDENNNHNKHHTHS